MKDNKNRIKRWLSSLSAVLAVTLGIALLAGCGNGNSLPVAAEPEETLTVEQRSLFLKAGESVQLTVSGPEVTFTSSRPEVATVDADGNVSAVGKGGALITIRSETQTAYCGVLVDASGTIVDLTGKQTREVFSDVMLQEPGRLSGLAVDKENQIFYLSQPYGTDAYDKLKSDVIVSRVEQNEKSQWEVTDWMRFYESGSGRVGLETEGADTWLWIESDGTYLGGGTSISRVAWQEEGLMQEEYGETYPLDAASGSAGPALDAENGLVVTYDNASKSYHVYDQEALVAGETAAYLCEVVCEKDQDPVMGEDESQGFYNASIRDYAVADGYIYQVSGASSLYISVFDLEGKLQYCRRVTDFEEMENVMPGGIAVADGTVYIAVTTGSSTYYYSSVRVFE